MSRYYILSERSGLRVVEAAGVIESHPLLVCFVGPDGTMEFDREDLLWWADAERVPWPFENLRGRHEPGYPGAMGASEIMREMHTQPTAMVKRSRLSQAAFEVLLHGMLKAMPNEWLEGVLDVQVSFEIPPGRYRLAHRLRNPSTGAEVMDFGETLFLAIEIFHRMELDLGENWVRCALTVRRNGEGKCDARMERHAGTNFARR